jgi:hypothetical protein
VLYLAALNDYTTFVTVSAKAVAEGGMTQAQLTQVANVLLNLALGGFNRAAYIAAIATEYIRLLRLVAIPTTFSLIPPSGAVSAYSITPDKPLYSPAEFLQDLSAWCNVFNVEQTIEGITPAHYGGADTFVLVDIQDADGNITESVAEQETRLRSGVEQPFQLLRVNFTADGQLELVGSALFWNNFTIRVTNYMMALMGLDPTGVTSLGGAQYLQFTGDSPNTPFTNPGLNDQILAGQNVVSHTLRTVVPIFQSCDQRVKVSVQSDLSYPSNVRIENEKEGRDRDICSGFFTNEVHSEITFVPHRGLQGISLHSLIYNGQHPFIKKTDHQHTWNRLLSSYDLRLLRFYLRVTYRDFHETDNKFTLSTKAMKVSDNDYWQMAVRFVSNV